MPNYQEPQNMTGLLDIFDYANTVSGGIYGVGVLISLYVIIFSYLKFNGNEASDCFVVAGFVTTVVAIFLFLAELLSNRQLFLAILAMILPVVWSFFNKST